MRRWDHSMIQAEGLVKSYGTIRALDGVDLTVGAGTVLALLGPNGAGKTTVVRILTTLLAPDAGRATVAGHDVVRDAQAVRRAVGLAGQYAAVDDTLTGRENLELVGRLYHMGRRQARDRADALLERFALADAADRPTKGYSGGMRRRLDLAASLVARPPVLFLDEPTTGLDPRSRIGLWEVIEALVEDGTTLLLTTQYLDEADRLADRIVVVDHGRVIAQGTADDLKSRVGGERLALRVSDRRELDRALTALRPLACRSRSVGSPAEQGYAKNPDGRLSGGGLHTDPATGEVTVPVTGGPAALVEAVRCLDAAGVGISDLALRRPTLDDVFLALTGRAAEDAAGQARPEREGATR